VASYLRSSVFFWIMPKQKKAGDVQVLYRLFFGRAGLKSRKPSLLGAEFASYHSLSWLRYGKSVAESLHPSRFIYQTQAGAGDCKVLRRKIVMVLGDTLFAVVSPGRLPPLMDVWWQPLCQLS
jgi:hypothetical protein